MSFPTFYVPHSSVVQSITNAVPAVVTTTTSHGLYTGMLVRVVFPPGVDFGMGQLPLNLAYPILVIDPTSFFIAFDTTAFDPFVLSTLQVAQIVPIGTFINDVPPLFLEAEKNNGNITPMYSWTNTTFPWVNSTSLVRH